MLKIEDLKFSFQNLTLFEDLNFELNPGEVLHLKGSNGSGKSTLLSLIAGLRSQFLGEIRFSVGSENVADRRTCIAYLAAENNGLYQRMSAKENIEFWSALEGRSLALAETEECLQHWGLSKAWLARMPVAKFSTGMKRRLGLARVLLSKRPCLLLDEPLNGLDIQGLALFKRKLEEHVSEKGSAIIVSHETRSIQDLISKELSLS